LAALRFVSYYAIDHAMIHGDRLYARVWSTAVALIATERLNVSSLLASLSLTELCCHRLLYTIPSTCHAALKTEGCDGLVYALYRGSLAHVELFVSVGCLVPAVAAKQEGISI